MSTYDYGTKTFITGSDPIATTCVTVTGGEDLPAFTPLGIVTASGKYKAFDPKATDGTETAVYLTPHAVKASVGDVETQVYKAGTFNTEVINWPAAITEAQKAGAFVGTPISLQLPTPL